MTYSKNEESAMFFVNLYQLVDFKFLFKNEKLLCHPIEKRNKTTTIEWFNSIMFKSETEFVKEWIDKKNEWEGSDTRLHEV